MKDRDGFAFHQTLRLTVRIGAMVVGAMAILATTIKLRPLTLGVPHAK
jgi:hypothetical protein